MNPKITFQKRGGMQQQDQFATIEGEPFTGCLAEVIQATGLELERYPNFSTGNMLVTKDTCRVVAVQVDEQGHWVYAHALNAEQVYDAGDNR